MTSSDLVARYERACGKTIRAWANFEFVLMLYLNAFIRVDQFIVRIVWLSMPNYQARRSLLNRLAETYLEEEPLRQFNIFMKRCSKMAAKRNMVGHGVGGISENGTCFFMRDDAGRENGGIHFLTEEKFHLTNVENWATDISRLERDMMDWLDELSRLIQPSPKMHREQRPDPENSQPAGPNPENSDKQP